MVEGIEPGQVLRLLDDLGEIEAGLYAVVEVGFLITLSRLGENEDGNLCFTHRTHKVTWAEIEQFISMELTIDGPL